MDDDELNGVDIDVLDATAGDKEGVRGGQPRTSVPRPVVDASVLPLFWRARLLLVVDAPS